MKVIYIKEAEEISNIREKTLLKIKRIFNIIRIENDNTYCLPIFKGYNLSRYKIKRLANKIYKLIENDQTNCIVLSEYLNNSQLLKNYLYSENINILDGKYLFKSLSCKILEYIYEIKNKPIELRRGFFVG